MKFIHAADLHLGSPFKGLTDLPLQIKQQVLQAITQSFTALIDTAVKQKVDFVILAGDQFDDVQRNLQAQVLLQQQLIRLADAQIPVFMVYGNHDYLTADQAMVNLPDNVRVFGPKVTTKTLQTKSGVTVAVSGFSYDQNHITTDRLAEYPQRQSQVDYQIGILHGQIGQPGDNYAPFTLQELMSKGYDYWALGHIHQRSILAQKPYIIYPGNIQGRHRNETEAKGFYLVNYDGQQTRPQFQASAPVIWQNVTLSVSDLTDIDKLMAAIQAAITVPENTLVEVTLTQVQTLPPKLLEKITSGELLATLQTLDHQQHFNYVYRLKTEAQPLQVYQSIDAQYWQAAAKEVFQADAIQKHLGKLQQVEAIRELYQQKDFSQWIQQQTLTLLEQNEGELQ